MKAGWTTKRLGEVCEIIKGRKPVLSPAPRPGDLPYLVAKYMRGSRDAEFASSTDRNSVVVAPNETIIICDGSNSGEVFTGFHGVLSSTMGKIASTVDIDPGYLRVFLAARFERFNGAKTGAAIPHLDKEALYALAIPVPPLPEQRRIVALLDEAFAGLATAAANAERNLDNARELFESDLAEVFSRRGDGWVETTLGECTRFIDYRGKTPIKTKSGLRLITAKNVKMGYLQRAPEEFVAPDSYSKWMTRGIPERGDVIFTTEAPLANVALLDTDERVVFAQRIIVLQPDRTRLDGAYLKYMLQSAPLQASIHAHGTGATVQGIKASLLKNIPVCFPAGLGAQTSVVRLLDALFAESQRLGQSYLQKQAALAALKRSLLHQAFNGEL